MSLSFGSAQCGVFRTDTFARERVRIYNLTLSGYIIYVYITIKVSLVLLYKSDIEHERALSKGPGAGENLKIIVIALSLQFTVSSIESSEWEWCRWCERKGNKVAACEWRTWIALCFMDGIIKFIHRNYCPIALAIEYRDSLKHDRVKGKGKDGEEDGMQEMLARNQLTGRLSRSVNY